ncbi:MAG: fumarylacetoacetate hydrolase family protein, partial [bacterium]
MRLYTLKDKQEVAVAYQGKLYPIKQFHISCQTMNELIIDEQAYAMLKGLKDDDFQGAEGYDEADCPLCAPIVTPLQDVICLGVNYLEHIEETTHVEDFRKKNATVYFSKRANEVTGHQGVVPHYDFVSQLDYEVELAVIIGKDAKGVSEAEALDYAFGYTIL